MKTLLNHIIAILPAAAPLLLASLGALVSEHAGVLAVFIDGAINISAFVCILVVHLTGSGLWGFIFAAIITMLILLATSVFTEKTRANPFITALALNLLASGLTSFLSVQFFGTRGTFALNSFTSFFLPRNAYFPLAFLLAITTSIFLKNTQPGLRLRASGFSRSALAARSYSASFYKSLSWVIAAFFAACAGTMLCLDLGAWVPNISAGRGWTALAAVFLGFKNPYLVALAVLVFSGAEYITNIMQGLGKFPATLILGLPYALSLLVFVFIKDKNN